MGDARGIAYMQALGKEWLVFVGLSALAEVEAKHKAELQALMRGKAEDPSLGFVRDFMLASLRRYHPDEATFETVDDIFAANPDALTIALKAAFPSAEGKEKPAARKAKATR